MKTHVWISGDKKEQFAPIDTLVLGIHLYPGEGKKIYLANDIVITKYRWELLKQAIDHRAVQLDNMSNGY